MAESRIDRQQSTEIVTHSPEPDCSISPQPPKNAIQHIYEFYEDVKKLGSWSGYDKLRWSGRMSNTFQMFSKSFHPGSYCPNGEFPDEGRGAHCAKSRMSEDLR